MCIYIQTIYCLFLFISIASCMYAHRYTFENCLRGFSFQFYLSFYVVCRIVLHPRNLCRNIITRFNLYKASIEVIKCAHELFKGMFGVLTCLLRFVQCVCVCTTQWKCMENKHEIMKILYMKYHT